MLPLSLRSSSLITPTNILKFRAPAIGEVPLCHQSSMRLLKRIQGALEMQQVIWIRGFFSERGNVVFSHLW